MANQIKSFTTQKKRLNHPSNKYNFNLQHTMTTKRTKEIQDIKEGLSSSQDVLINKALDKMERKGDSTLLPDVIELWSLTDEQPIKKRAEAIMFGLKDKGALKTLIDYLGTDASEDKKWFAANAIWQSGFDASAHLTELIDFAITNSFTAAIDVMTIIENSEFNEEVEDTVDENIKRINRYIAQSKSENVSILTEISSILIDKKIEG